MKLNPNHPVTQQLDDELMHKLCAVLVMKAGGNAEITTEDLHELHAMFAGDAPTLVTNFGQHAIKLTLVSLTEGRRLAAEVGGLPQ